MPRLSSLARTVLVLALAVGMQGTVLVEAIFVLRQNHIAEHHCVNRHQPEMECNGKCFLAKRVADAHGHDHDDAVPRVAAPRPDVWSVLSSVASVPSTPVVVHRYPRRADRPPPSHVHDDIFRPPWETTSR